MTGYERVLKTYTFDNPDRVPLKYGTIGKGDIRRIFLNKSFDDREVGYIPDMLRKDIPTPGARDEWGIVWENSDNGTGLGLGQPVEHPIKNWEESFEQYEFPDPHAHGRFEGLEEALAVAEKEGQWVQLNSQYCMFERFHMLRGYENAMLDFYMEKEKLIQLVDKALDFQIGIVREAAKLAKGRIHCFDTSDDWGTQTSLVINPELFREIFKPRYKILADEVHSHGMYLNLHSCGHIEDIMEDLIEVGVDAINIHQPTLFNIKEFGKKYAGRITFDVSVDIQQTLPKGNKDKIEQEVKDLLEYWGTPQGGIVAAEYRFLKAIGVTQKSFEYAYECWVKHGDYNRS